MDDMDKYDYCFPLKTEMLHVDEFGRMQMYAEATVIYIISDNKILLIKQTKKDRVAGDNYIGLGGKGLFKSLFGDEVTKTTSIARKVAKLYDPANLYLLTETYEEIATMEVFEETEGFMMDKDRLSSIGQGIIKILNENANARWHLQYYGFVATNEEAKTINVGKMREGIIEWHDIEEIDNLPMLPADRIMLNCLVKSYRDGNVLRDNVTVEAIYDDLDGEHKIRAGMIDDNHIATFLLIPDFHKPREYSGMKIDITDTAEQHGMLGIPTFERLSMCLWNGTVMERFSYPENIILTPNSGKVESKEL